MRKFTRIALPVLALVMALAAAGCGASSPTGASSSKKDTAASSCPAPKSGFQKGVAVLWNPPVTATGSAQRATDIATYAHSIGANSISVNYLFNVSGPTGNKVFPGTYTPTNDSLTLMINAAKAAGLKVVLRPIVDEANIPRPGWRGTIQPTDRAAWFKSYGDLMESYAKLAQSTCVDEFTIGVELNSMQTDVTAWQNVASRVRAAGYHGDLSYAANWDAPAAFSFGNHPGVDFYPNLKISESATLKQLTTAMVKVFDQMPTQFQQGAVIQEAGLSAYGAKYSASSSWAPSSSSTFGKQKTWLEAVCATAKDIKASGLYFWGLSYYSNPLHPTENGLGAFAFEGRPAADAVRACFAQRS